MQRKDKVKSAGAPTAAPQPAPASSLSAEERDQRLYQAVLAYRSARYAEADAAARELRAAVADFFPALLLGGMVAGKCGRGAEGIELLREAVALDPQSAEARSELASLLRSEGRTMRPSPPPSRRCGSGPRMRGTTTISGCAISPQAARRSRSRSSRARSP